jgi:hypothetical protein
MIVSIPFFHNVAFFFTTTTTTLTKQTDKKYEQN